MRVTELLNIPSPHIPLVSRTASQPVALCVFWTGAGVLMMGRVMVTMVRQRGGCCGLGDAGNIIFRQF